MKVSRVNVFEVVLWILAGILIVGSAVALVKYLPALLAPSTSNTSATSRAIGQIVYLASPMLFAVGFGLAGMAIAVRAVDYNARRRQAEIEATPTAQVAEPASVIESTPSSIRSPFEPVEPRAEAPTSRRAAFARPQSPDPSIFMRPRD